MPQMTLLVLMAALTALFTLQLPSRQEQDLNPRAEALARHFLLFRRACLDAADDHPGETSLSTTVVLDYLPPGTSVPDGWLCLREENTVYACGSADSPDLVHVRELAGTTADLGRKDGATLVPCGGAAPSGAAQGAVVLRATR